MSSSQGPNNGTASDYGSGNPGGSFAGGSKAWTNVANLDGSSAFGTCTLSASFPNTDVAEVMAFGFSLPAGATVNGIVVSFKGSDSSSGTHAGTTYVQLLKGGAPTGTAKTLAMPSSSTTETLGSSSDLWGGSFAASDINGSTFGVGIQEQGASGNNTLSIQNVQITVYYTAGSPGTPVGGVTSIGGGAAASGGAGALAPLPIVVSTACRRAGRW